jgi:hypothetical protein
MKSIIRACLLSAAAVSSLAAQATETTCNATYRTVVFDYAPSDDDPFLQKLFDMTKAMTGKPPDEILAAYFAEGKYEVFSRDYVVVTAGGELNWSEGFTNGTPIVRRANTGKDMAVTTLTGWRYKYYALPVEGQISTTLTVERFVATPATDKPLTLSDRWLATKGQNRIKSLGKYSNAYSVLTQLVSTDCH